jgi:hypothetical protein
LIGFGRFGVVFGAVEPATCCGTSPFIVALGSEPGTSMNACFLVITQSPWDQKPTPGFVVNQAAIRQPSQLLNIFIQAQTDTI